MAAVRSNSVLTPEAKGVKMEATRQLEPASSAIVVVPARALRMTNPRQAAGRKVGLANEKVTGQKMM
eukprot:1589755-Pleurochrysis_carterae.AAC.1